MEDKNTIDKSKNKDKPELPDNNKQPGSLQSIEALASKAELPVYVFAGVKAQKGWGTGKKVNEAEFKKAIQEFLGSLAQGKGGK